MRSHEPFLHGFCTGGPCSDQVFAPLFALLWRISPFPMPFSWCSDRNPALIAGTPRILPQHLTHITSNNPETLSLPSVEWREPVLTPGSCHPSASPDAGILCTRERASLKSISLGFPSCISPHPPTSLASLSSIHLTFINTNHVPDIMLVYHQVTGHDREC